MTPLGGRVDGIDLGPIPGLTIPDWESWRCLLDASRDAKTAGLRADPERKRSVAILARIESTPDSGI